MYCCSLLCVLLLGCASVGLSLDLDSMLHDPTTVVYKLPPASPQESTTYTTGFLRTDYTDVGPEGKFFVQGEVLAIGVCYSSYPLVSPGAPSAEPTAEPTAPPTTAAGLTSAAVKSDMTVVNKNNVVSQDGAHLRTVQVQQVPAKAFQMLTAVKQDIRKKTFTLYYTDYSDAVCSIALDSFTVEKRFQGSAVTSHGVQLKTDRRYIESVFLATSVPSFNNGYVIRYDVHVSV